MNFGEALKYAKEGHAINRSGWNSQLQYVEIAKKISYENANGERVNADHKDVGSACLAFNGTRGVQLGWLASQSDMLAEDWNIVNREAIAQRRKEENTHAKEM